MAAKNEVAKTEEKKEFNLQIFDGAMAEAIAEEMDGLGTIPFDKVRIPSGGGLAFEIPGEDEDNPETAQELVGVILDHHPINAYWREKYSGGNEQPDCSSYDGKTGVDAETGEMHDCSSCPHNQFGSDGAGKACKNIHRCYLLREGNPVPIVISLPPTSLKYMRDYIGKKILMNGLRCWDAVTKITLKKEKSTDNITYSRAVFTMVGTLNEAQRAETKKMAETIKATEKNVPVIDDADYNTAPSSQPAVDNTEFQPVPEGKQGELPFE